MNWDAIGALAELLGAVGVITSLFYLGAQVRQNTKSLRASSYHAVVTNLSSLSGSIGVDAPASDLFVRAISDFSEMEPHEQRQCALLFVSLFRNYEDIFYQFDQNMVDSAVWGGWEHSMTRMFWQPGVQAWWPTWRDDCHAGFREFLEASTRPPAPMVNEVIGKDGTA